MVKRSLLHDASETTVTRFVTFTAGNHRFELALLVADYFNDQTLVIDLLGTRHGLIDKDNIHQPGHLEHVFQLNQMEAEQLRSYLNDLL
ncbi:DUF3055 family protein [Halobacillus rhizosphaerae]|uniref:SAV0927 family protein n=1 Tax=Halobacillus rhizosphaerae TaxID=3064889 RepID=UPI00398B9BD7